MAVPTKPVHRPEKVVKEGSTLGNIAREYGYPKLGHIMDQQAIIHGDHTDVSPKGADHYRHQSKRDDDPQA